MAMQRIVLSTIRLTCDNLVNNFKAIDIGDHNKN